MDRKGACLALLALAVSACRKEGPPFEAFPESVAGWRRTEFRHAGASEAPDPVSRTSIQRLQLASYDGPGKLEARAYEVTSPAVALGLMQRWHPSADTVFFYRGRWFVVVKWQEADRAALQSFIRELEKRLPLK